MVASLSLQNNSTHRGDGLRPVNLKTDLAPLADLIELVFADNMDSSGRAALREMRMLSNIGLGLNMLAQMNDLAMGIKLGYVWIEDGKLVGNVSIYPANLPEKTGRHWIIANVGVHPDYQRRGIARQLMHASLDMIRDHGGGSALLQVNYHNEAARNLYKQLGFYDERAWSLWRRSGASRLPLIPEVKGVHITHRQRNEWQAEYALAQKVRPASRGGLGWLRPLHPRYFRHNLGRIIGDIINLRFVERLAVRNADDPRTIDAAMWIEKGFGSSSRLTMFVEPRFMGLYDEALVSNIVRRYGNEPLVIEHPYDETVTNTILEHYRFYRHRSVYHMRWDSY
jgi:ribosomal protein S18 acetylase RimI-like enzyme